MRMYRRASLREPPHPGNSDGASGTGSRPGGPRDDRRTLRRMRRLGLVSFAALLAVIFAVPAMADDVTPPTPKPHVGFYVIHPRVGLSTYFSLTSYYAGTQAPIRAVAKVHPAGETCGATPADDTGTPMGEAVLQRDNHHTVWKDWTPTRAGVYTVCTWLGDPAVATGSKPLIVQPSTGPLVSASTSGSLSGAPQRCGLRLRGRCTRDSRCAGCGRGSS